MKSFKPDLKFSFVTLAALTSIRFWSLKAVPDKILDGLEIVVLVALFLIVVLSKEVKNNTDTFKTNVSLFIWIPILSSFGALLFHGQSLGLSMGILRTNFFWLIYFVLHIYKVPARKVIALMVVLGAGWALITTIQQFTYPHYFFYRRNEEVPYDFFRAGLYRYLIDQHQYGLFIVVIFFWRYLVTRKVINLLMVGIGLAGLYYFGTRQFVAAALICMVIAALMQKGRTRVFAVVTIAGVVAGLFVFRDVLFGEVIEMTNDQLGDQDDVRLKALNFYFFEYWPHWLTFFTGNGFENAKSPYGQEMLYINEVRLMYRSDIGIVGALNTFGIFYVINIFWVNIKGLQSRYYSGEASYLKLFFIHALMLLPLTEYYSVPSGAVPFYCFVFYLVEKSYEVNLNKKPILRRSHAPIKQLELVC